MATEDTSCSYSNYNDNIWFNVSRELEPHEYSLLIYIPNFLDIETYNKAKEWLSNKYKNNNFVGGDGVAGKPIPRKQLWFQRDGHYFCKTWKSRIERWKSNEYDERIMSIQEIVSNKLKSMDIEGMTGFKERPYKNMDFSFDFNSCLVNLYRDGNDSIAAHRDSIQSFGLYPTIVGLSIGETRIMRIQRVYYNEDNEKSCKMDNINKKGLTMEFPLEDNSIFIMAGTSQKYYTHEILKDETIKEERYSMTFRKYMDL